MPAHSAGRCALGWARSFQSAHPVWTNPLQALAEPWERARKKVLIRVAWGAVAGGPGGRADGRHRMKPLAITAPRALTC